MSLDDSLNVISITESGSSVAVFICSPLGDAAEYCVSLSICWNFVVDAVPVNVPLSGVVWNAAWLCALDDTLVISNVIVPPVTNVPMCDQWTWRKIGVPAT